MNAHKAINILIAIVWLINGLFCKILNLVPRHQEIVARILGDQYARPFTFMIGLSEIVMMIWVLSGWKSRINALLQIGIVGTMNVIEFFLAPDLLLWGKFNALFALLFMALVYFNEFVLGKKTNQAT